MHFAVIVFLLVVCHQIAYAQSDPWKDWMERAKHPTSSGDVSVWAKAMAARGDLPGTDIRQLIVLNRFIRACQMANWRDECGGWQRREGLLSTAYKAADGVEPRDLLYADELVVLAKLHGQEESNRAIRALSDSLSLVEQLKGVDSLEASERWLELASIHYSADQKQQARMNLEEALKRQMNHSGKASVERVEFLVRGCRLATAVLEVNGQGRCREAALKEIGGTGAGKVEKWRMELRLLDGTPRPGIETAVSRLEAGMPSQGLDGKSKIRALLKMGEALGDVETIGGRRLLMRADREVETALALEDLKERSIVLESLHQKLAASHLSQSQHAEAGERFVRAAKAAENAYGRHTSDVANDLGNAAEAFAKASDSSSAEKCFQELQDTKLPFKHPAVAQAAVALGDLYRQRQEWDKAVKKYEAAVDLENLGASDRESARRLADAYRKTGQTKKAKAMEDTMGSDGLGLSHLSVWHYYLIGIGTLLGTFAIPAGLSAILFVRAQSRVSRKLDMQVAPGGPGTGHAMGVSALGLGMIAVPEAEAIEPAVVAETQPQKAERFSFHGAGADLFGMRIFHLLLTIVTFGFFSFWGKTRVRKYLCAQAEFLGDRFCFHGTGTELLRGWLKGVPLLAVLFLFPRVAPIVWGNASALALINVAAGLGFLLLWPLARVGAFRYRMNRMSWRGIRFRFFGSTKDYFRLSVAGYVGILFTLGIWTSRLAMEQRRYLYNHSSVGDREFSFTGDSGDLFWTWFFGLPMTVFSFGLGWFWVSALRSRYYWAHTTLGEARFHCSATGWGLAKLGISNLLLFLFTLGLGSSWAAMRTVRYWSEHLELRGELNADGIGQRVEESSAVGESFADFIGFDFGL
jgi:uncharacterized membrane protein YjgN (DUF898 family)/tetratricopeptide (TPR) repeat protein